MARTNHRPKRQRRIFRFPPLLATAKTERVHTVLERHCSRCHQSGALQGRSAAEGGIANILSLDAVARNPALIRPGEPDSSPLYQQMIARQMPPDGHDSSTHDNPPDAAEIRAVRAWIKSLNGQFADACPNRTPLTRESIITTLSRWMETIGPQRAADTRFISLANIYQACASDAELAAYRQGVVTLLNGLTRSPKPVEIDTIGDTLALLAVRLSDLGWTKEHWEELASRVPVATRLDFSQQILQQAGTAVPILAGDWLAHEVMQPELYNQLLGLPPTIDDLARLLGIDLVDARKGRTVRRGVTHTSAITGAPRVIERYATTRGSLWMSHDYAASQTASILDSPLLPWASNNGEDSKQKPPLPLGSRALFALPNGSPAFMLFDADGNARLTQTLPAPPNAGDAPEHPSGQPSETKPETHSSTPAAQSETSPPAATTATNEAAITAIHATAKRHVRNGMSCTSCHAMGPLAFEDQLSAHLAGDHYQGNSVERDIARSIAFSKPELESNIADDRNSAQRALSSMGVDAATRIDGHDVVTGLAAHYMRDLDVATAAAELLIPEALLQKHLSNLSRTATPAAALAIRLTLGRLSRDEFEVLRSALPLNENTPPTQKAPVSSQPAPSFSASKAQATATPPPASGNLHLWPDKISYNRDDRIVLNVSAAQPCYLTLVNIDPAGHATVLFPNEFTRENLLKANEVKRLPAADALYFFRLQRPGTESFVAICEAEEPVPAGMRPDFTRMNFTELGDWETFLDNSIKAAHEPRVPLNNGDDIDRKRGKRQAPRPAVTTTPDQSRAAITITIAP